ncbi:MAG: hypothetical protein ACQCN6_14915, partial [Candidatus Bathyarchaeia archaeon]
MIVSSLVFITLSASAASTASIYLNPATVPTDALTVGDTFEVTIQIADVNALWQWAVKLSWNPD